MLALYEKYLSGKTGFLAYFVGTKAKDRISNLVFQEALQIFRKMNFSYPLICTRKCAYQGLRNVCFSGNLTCFVFFFCNTRFEIHPFALLPTILQSKRYVQLLLSLLAVTNCC